jgi:hypothetical protein
MRHGQTRRTALRSLRFALSTACIVRHVTASLHRIAARLVGCILSHFLQHPVHARPGGGAAANAIQRRAKAGASHLLRGMLSKCYLAQGMPVKGYFAGRKQAMAASRFEIDHAWASWHRTSLLSKIACSEYLRAAQVNLVFDIEK